MRWASTINLESSADKRFELNFFQCLNGFLTSKVSVFNCSSFGKEFRIRQNLLKFDTFCILCHNSFDRSTWFLYNNFVVVRHIGNHLATTLLYYIKTGLIVVPYCNMNCIIWSYIDHLNKQNNDFIIWHQDKQKIEANCFCKRSNFEFITRCSWYLVYVWIIINNNVSMLSILVLVVNGYLSKIRD